MIESINYVDSHRQLDAVRCDVKRLKIKMAAENSKPLYCSTKKVGFMKKETQFYRFVFLFDIRCSLIC